MRTTLIYDFDQINQAEVFTFSDGTDVEIPSADLTTLRKVRSQLEDRRGDYLAVWNCGCDGRFSDAPCSYHKDFHPHVDDDPMIYTPLWQAVRSAIDAHPVTVARRRRRDATRAMLALLFQDEIWRTADGRELRLDDMDVRHLGNTMQWLQRNERKLAMAHRLEWIDAPNGGDSRAFADTQGDWLQRTPLFRRMQQLHDDASPLAHAAGAVRQKARTVHHKVTGRWPS